MIGVIKKCPENETDLVFKNLFIIMEKGYKSENTFLLILCSSFIKFSFYIFQFK